MNQIKLIRLKSKIDSVLHFKNPDDDSTSGMGLGTAAVGTGVAGTAALYGTGVASMRGAGGMPTSMGNIMKSARLDTSNIGQGGAGRIARTIGQGANVAAKTGGDLVQNIIAKARGVKLEARPTNMIELNAHLDGLIQLEDLTGRSNKKGQRPEDNVRRGVGIGLIGGGPSGAVMGGLEADKYRKAGVILRKRDVIGHDAVGGLTSVVGGGVGQLLGHLHSPKARVIGGVTGTLAGYVAGRTAISNHTLNRRKEELKQGVQV